jgi:hypothetical protein
MSLEQLQDKVPYLENFTKINNAIRSQTEMVANVVDYGATGDGATEDNDAINDAINDVFGAGGGVVYLPAGTYIVTRSDAGKIPEWTIGGNAPAIYVPSNVSIVGAGKGVTTIQLSASAPINTSTIMSADTINTTVANLRLLGKNTGVWANVEEEGINYKNNCKKASVLGVKFEDIQSEAIDIDLDDAGVEFDALGEYQYLVRDCDFIGCGGEGVHNANWTLIENCSFNDMAALRYGAVPGAGTEGQGAIDSYGQKTTIRNCSFVDCARAYHKYGEYGSLSECDIVIDNCTIYGSLGEDILSQNSTNPPRGTVSNVRVTGAYPRVLCHKMINCRIDADLTVLDVENTSVVNMDGCHITGLGVDVYDGSSDVTITNCSIDRTGNTNLPRAPIRLDNDIDGLVVQGCTLTQVASATGPCLGTVGSPTHTNINIIGNYMSGGNRVLEAWNNYNITANTCVGGSIGSIRLRGDDSIASSNRVYIAPTILGTNCSQVNNLVV